MLATQVHPEPLPSIEVALDVDGPADRPARRLLRVPDAPELLEGLRAVDGGRVVAPGGEDVVRGAVAGDGALVAGRGGRVVGAVGLDDVVLDERAARPAVDGEVAVAVGLVGAGVGDGAAFGRKSGQ